MSSIKIPRCLQLTFENSLRWFKKGFSNESFFLFPRHIVIGQGWHIASQYIYRSYQEQGNWKERCIALIIKMIKDLKHEHTWKHTNTKYIKRKKRRKEGLSIILHIYSGEICHCRHCRRQCKIFCQWCKFLQKHSFFRVFITKAVEIQWN